MSALNANTPVVARPGLAFHHALDWLASQLAATGQPAFVLAPHTFLRHDLAQRLPSVTIAATCPSAAVLAATPTLAAVLPELAQLERFLAALPPGSRLYLITAGLLAGRLAEFRLAPDSPAPVSTWQARRALRHRRCHLLEQFGIHGPAAIAWHLLSLATHRLQRPAWADRCHYALRRAFVVRRWPCGPAALTCLLAEAPQ